VRQPVPFGKYLLLDRISVGGMAEVFKAKSYGVEGFEKIIAIKRILPTMGEDRDFIKMFIDEAKIAGQLAHANICQIFELGRIDGSHFIAMEYIWGKDLLQIQNRLRKIKQPMPIAMACFSIAKVLEGLDYAHRKRDPLGRPLEIVHRDCSPQNVLVSYEGEVKVIDFGIAKATSRNSRTMAGVLKGKFGYMSPEQVRGLPLDRRSDIFALGTMLYECLTGDRLFQGETDFSTLEKVRNVDIRPPREINPNIPQAVEAVILKALAKDVDERYQWCSEMLADLQAFLMSQDVVFTAKSLSSWLKEVFATEIDRERQQLEQYKRVGRDGLIAGLPAAEARADVVESFGEAAPVEGDPTMLGGPNFEDLEQAARAALEVGPAPGSPAARGSSHGEHDEDGPMDFGEEAPTEIFGEIDHGVNPAAQAQAAAAPQATPSRAAAAPLPPLTRPPKPPPASRAATSREPSQPVAGLPGMPPAPGPQPPRPSGPASGEIAAAGAPPVGPGYATPSYADPANAGATYQQYGQPHAPGPGYTPQSQPAMGQPMGQQAGPVGSQPIGLGTPGPQPPPNGIPPLYQGNQSGMGKTLLGAAAPVGLPNYSQGYPPPPQPGQLQPYQQPPYGQYPGNGQMQPTMLQPGQGPPYQGSPYPQVPNQGSPYPQVPNQGSPYPQVPQSPNQGSPYPQVPPNPYGPSNPYNTPGPYAAPSAPYNAAVPPLEQIAPPDAKKRSSIVRDVAIGVAIAVLVLSGFLAVKYVLLDGDSSEPTAPTSSYANIRLSIAGGITAELFVDGKKTATVGDKQEIPVPAGTHKVKLVGPGGDGCEQEMKLEAGKTKTLECTLNVAPASPGSGDKVPGTPAGGSAAAAGSAGEAPGAAGGASPAGAATGSAPGSATAPVPGATDVKPSGADPKDTPVPDKTDRMPVEDKKPSARAVDPADRPIDKPVRAQDKPADHPASVATKPPDRSADKPKPAKVAVDDELGRLDGGTKPGDKKPDDKAKPAADAKGYVAITSSPPARISIDGKDTGLSTPITGHTLPLSPGKHKVMFLIGGDKFTFSVVIKPGETAAVHKELQ
jgi:serine/threonine protein kinase